MKTILLVGPNTANVITNTRWVTAPLGIHYLASWLNANGHHAETFDVNLDEHFEERVRYGYNGKPWDIVGFSILEASLEYDLAKIHKAKKASSASLLIAGGSGASLNYQVIFNKSPLDMVIQAEGEYPLLSLCNMLDKYGFAQSPIHTIQGIIIRNYAKALSAKEYQDIRSNLNVSEMRADKYWGKTFSLYENPNLDEIYTFRLFTSNYCPMGCAFCTLTRLRKYACGQQVKVIGLESSQIIDLMKNVIKTYPQCRQIYFVDDDFLLIKKRAIEFCNEVIRLKKTGELPQSLRLLCGTSIIRITNDIIPLLAKAGFGVINIGAESLSQSVLNSLNKKQDISRIWETTDLLLQYGIKPHYTLLLFTPKGKLRDFIHDIKGFKRLSETGASISIEPYLIPLRGTRLAEEQSPERVRMVPIDGTNEVLYKGFAWLPMDTEVKQIFNIFEEIYPKYRKFRGEMDKNKHLEKNWLSLVVLNAAALSIYSKYGNIEELKEVIPVDADNILKELSVYPTYNIDSIGNVI